MCLACDGLSAFGRSVDPCLCGAPETFAVYRRIEADLSRREMLGGSAAILGMFAGFGLAPGKARGQTPGRPLLLSNLRYFDGETLAMQEGRDILIAGGRIAGFPTNGEGPEDAEIIDCGGRSVIPGLIDCHWHSTIVAVTQIVALTQDIAFVHLAAGREAGATLRRGFTTVRDMAGPSFGLKLAIDQGVVEGPRIFPSGAALSQTSGHGDFRFLHEVPRLPSDLSYVEREGIMMLADGVDEVLRRTREQLMKGASQIKIMAGGGVSSLYDPLDSLQYTAAEMRAAVDAASDWGTYVAAHVYTSEGIRRCVEAGVKSIEHGQLADEETVEVMAGEGVWWSIQPFFDDEDANPQPEPASRAKQIAVSEGTERAFELMTRHDVKLAFGTDILFVGPQGGLRQGRQLAKFARFLSPLEALRTATGAAGELLAMSGERAPYEGRLGVIAEGAIADLLVVDDDPEAGLDWLDDPDGSLSLIMKGGRVVKDSL